VDNEGQVLAQLNHLDFVPKLNLQVSKKDYSLIQTSILKGERLAKQKIEGQILNVLIELAKQKVNTEKRFESALKTCFAHGDFCPWNMMLDEDKLNVFDWEMAGIYPLGYDLFTYIFQTSFLLHPNTTIEKLLYTNKALINSYFKTFKISNWQNYLHAFGSIKVELEKAKGVNSLLNLYQKLHIHAQKL
jgi:aminoglycoside phosphotransferase (APT) family kinase protein